MLLTDEDAIRETLAEWYQGLPLHPENGPDLSRLLRHMDGYVESVPKDAKADRPEPAGPLDGIASLCRMFPGTTPDYWRSGISIAETDALLESSNSDTWAESHRRTKAIENYLRAVKWIRTEHAKH